MLLDLQLLTIYRHVSRQLPTWKGNVLDLGCGHSPYRFLLDADRTQYFGLDIADADKFDYRNSEIIPFDGGTIPFADGTFDHILCTEVLEHVSHFQDLIDEMHRVLKPDGDALVTVPWSARHHYVPHDYFRYSPTALRIMFAQFSQVDVQPRGSDVAVIANKVILLWCRNAIPTRARQWLLAPMWWLFAPMLAVIVVMAQIHLSLGLGPGDDPLGYTVVARK